MKKLLKYSIFNKYTIFGFLLFFLPWFGAGIIIYLKDKDFLPALLHLILYGLLFGLIGGSFYNGIYKMKKNNDKQSESIFWILTIGYLLLLIIFLAIGIYLGSQGGFLAGFV